MSLTDDQTERYSRQIIMKEFGGAKQEKLLASTALLVGAGGLGSPIALYLAAAGVGRLIIADGDEVDLSNLGRQILHATDRIGQSKAESARETLSALNPDVEFTIVNEHLTEENVDPWIAEADVVVDGSDNFNTRYLMNDACHRGGKTLIFGAVLGFEGQLSVFKSGVDAALPCYRCLYPERPAPGAAPTCATAGVLGSLTGMVGSMQATEAVKELLGLGTSLAGSLLLVNALDGVYHKIGVSKDPGCGVCSTFKNPQNYE